jgi:hypothetical protein
MKTNLVLCLTSALISAGVSFFEWSRAEEPVADFGVAVGKPLPFYAIAGIVPTGMFNFFYLFLDLVIVFVLVLFTMKVIVGGLSLLIKNVPDKGHF